MAKKRDGIMTFRLPVEEKEMLQAFAQEMDVSLSDLAVKACRRIIAEIGAMKTNGATLDPLAPAQAPATPAPAPAPKKGKK